MIVLAINVTGSSTYFYQRISGLHEMRMHVQSFSGVASLGVAKLSVYNWSLSFMLIMDRHVLITVRLARTPI